jgi:hypothetical protein
MSKKDEQIITEYNEQDELNLVIDDIEDTDEIKETQKADDNFNQDIKSFGGRGASVKVTISEAKPFGDQPYASDHL